MAWSWTTSAVFLFWTVLTTSMKSSEQTTTTMEPAITTMPPEPLKLNVQCFGCELKGNASTGYTLRHNHATRRRRELKLMTNLPATMRIMRTGRRYTRLCMYTFPRYNRPLTIYRWWATVASSNALIIKPRTWFSQKLALRIDLETNDCHKMITVQETSGNFTIPKIPFPRKRDLTVCELRFAAPEGKKIQLKMSLRSNNTQRNTRHFIVATSNPFNFGIAKHYKLRDVTGMAPKEFTSLANEATLRIKYWGTILKNLQVEYRAID